MTLAHDPFMLMSQINTLLRDHYASLVELCASEDIDEDALRQQLAEAGFEYNAQNNKFW